MTKKSDGPFFVRTTLTSLPVGPGIIARGVDDDGYEVVFVMSKAAITEARERKWAEFAAYVLEVQGHNIIAYSGEYGPWGPAATPRALVDRAERGTRS